MSSKQHVCQRCGHKSKNKSALKKHYERKRPCKDELECGKDGKDLLKEMDKPDELFTNKAIILVEDLGIMCNMINSTTQEKSKLVLKMNITIYNNGKEFVDSKEFRKEFIKEILEVAGINFDDKP